MSTEAELTVRQVVHNALNQESIHLELQGDYKSGIRAMFNAMVAKHGPTLKGIYNSWGFAQAFTTVQPHLTQDKDRVYSIKPELLDMHAKLYAHQIVEKWEHKILTKLGDVDSCRIAYLRTLTFEILAARGPYSISLTQSCILKVSPHGKLHNQFPARLYVNGKFTPETAYHAMFAALEAPAAATTTTTTN